MNRFFRWYYKNKFRFWIIILAIAGLYSIILLFNNIARSSLRKKSEGNVNNSKVFYTNKYSIKNSSSVLGENESKEELNKASEVIDNFIKCCNNGQVEEAYKFLTSECKQLMFPSLEDFRNGYYNNVFSVTKTYKMQNWYQNTYKIEYKDSLLATGGKKTGEFIRDYITLVTQDDETKININNYLGRTKINSSYEKDGVTINVLNKDTFMDYEIYNLEVDNKSQNTVMLDDLENSTSVFVKDENGGKHYFYMNELTENMLTVKTKQNKNISIKFTNSYITDRDIISINFSNYIANNATKNKIDLSISL